MISSVWLIDREKGSLLAERHWKGRLGTRTASRICLEEGSTVCTKRPHYVVRVDRKKLRAIASSLEEFPPADVIELLSRVLDEMDKKKDPVEAQMLFDEMLDGGLPATTSQVALHSLLPEEDLSQRVSSMLLGNQRITEGSAALPWRRSGISHLKNEFLVDIVEEVHAIVDRGGRHRNAFLVGHVVATSRLSGFPDLMLKFSNPEVMDVCNVHPCVRLKPFQDGRVLSFVPPDGKFTLLSYTAKVTKDLDVVIPIYVRLQTAKDTIVRGLKVNMVVCFKPSPLKVVDDITLSFNLPRETSTVDLDVNQGTLRTEHDTGCCTWDIGQMDQTLTPCLSGTLFSRNSDTLEGLSFAPVARLSYSCAQDTISDLRLQSLKLMNEPQQPYRGLRSIVRSGTYEVCL